MEPEAQASGFAAKPLACASGSIRPLIAPRALIAYCLSGLSELAFAEAEYERAARLLGASEELFRDVGVGVDTGEAETQERVRTGLYETLGEARSRELCEAGAAMRPEELV